MFLCLYKVTLFSTKCRGRNASGNVYLDLELGKDSRLEGVGIPWCIGVIHELGQRKQKEETAQDGSGDHYYVRG